MQLSEAFKNMAALGSPIANSLAKTAGVNLGSELYNQLSVGFGIFFLIIYLVGVALLIYSIAGYFTFHFKFKDNEDVAQLKKKRNHLLIWGLVSAAGLFILPSLAVIICGLTSEFTFHPQMIGTQ